MLIVGGFSIISIARIYVSSDKFDEVGKSHNDIIWDYVLENHEAWRNQRVVALYVTQHQMQDQISLILDVLDQNQVGDFISNHFSTQKEVEGVWFFNLVQPKFFHLQKKTPRDYKRYVLTISAEPQEYANIYNKIIELWNSKLAIVTYISYIFQPIGKDIQVSVVAKDSDAVAKYAENIIMPIKGIKDVDISPIARTKKLVSNELWQDHIKQFIFNISSLEEDKDSNNDFEPWDYTESFVCC